MSYGTQTTNYFQSCVEIRIEDTLVFPYLKFLKQILFYTYIIFCSDREEKMLLSEEIKNIHTNVHISNTVQYMHS